MWNNSSERLKDDCVDDNLSIATFDSSNFHPNSSTLRPSDIMSVSVKERGTVAVHPQTGEITLPVANRSSSHQPRKHKKYALQDQSRAGRNRSAVKERVSHTEEAYQQDPEGPVGIPVCMLEAYVESLVPLTGVDEQDGLASEHDHSSYDNVKQPPRVRQQSYDECQLLDSNEVERKSSTEIAPKSPTSYDLPSPALSSLDLEKVESLGSTVHKHYCSISGGSLTQEMLWEVEALGNTKSKAPVTKDNLKELDLPSIQNTISLRFDLCFDQGLFFQRVSGAKGNEKRTKARIFYRYMSLELQVINHNLRGSCETCEKSNLPRPVMQSRLACYFWSLRELLILLVPDSEKATIEESIDPTWLTRLVRVGHFEAVQFSTWLYKLLTKHCAPMRDAMARDMSEKLSNGAVSGDMDLLANGMEVLLSLLENMKIDIANHQIRTFKVLLIADTVPFLKDCFTKMRDNGQIKLQDSRKWYQKIRQSSSGQSEFESFIQGFILLLCTVEDDFALPLTFRYGEDRIHGLRNEILDYAHLEICMEAYRTRLEGTTVGPAKQQALKTRILQLMSNEGVSEGVRQHVQPIGVEIWRAVSVSEHTEEVESSGTYYDELYDEQPEDLSSSSCITNLLDDMHGDLECFLNEREKDELASLAFKLYEPTLAIAKKFLKMETLQISNYQRSRHDQRASTEFPELLAPDIADISSKLAHMGVVHWQIWAELAYLDDF